MATKEMELKKLDKGLGCLARASDDEPVFILRAKDKLAPSIIEEWVKRAEHSHAILNGSTELNPITETKFREARALAHEMRAWQALNDCKLPD